MNRFIYRYLPQALFVCYGLSMAVLFYQWQIVGLWGSIVRFAAWQFVLLLALADRSHLDSKERVDGMQEQINAALRTVGIRRHEFDDLKNDLKILREYLARTDRVTFLDAEKTAKNKQIEERVDRALNTLVP